MGWRCNEVVFRRLVVLPLVVSLFACGHSPTASRPTASTPTASTLGTQAGSNQIRLTAAESARLVAWAETFRSCMLAEGISLGGLEKSETQIRMALPGSVDVDNLLAKTATCGDRQGGPPHRSSLQYRPGEIVLYLPKQCLLDKKVAAS
jgi:hypothetical protein